MDKSALEGLGAVIKANTKRRTLDELKAEGKKHVRVVSGQKVMKIIQAVAGDIIDREVGELTQRDRTRIVEETKRRFDRVLKMQTEQEERVKEMRDALRKAEHQVESLKGDKAFLESQLAAARKSAGDTQSIGRIGADLAQLKASMDSAEQRWRDMQHTAIEKISNRLDERDASGEARAVSRLAAELDEIRATMQRVEDSSHKMKADLLDAVADVVAQRTDGQTEVVSRLGGELEGIRSSLTSLDDMSDSITQATAAAVFDKLREREAKIAEQWQDQFKDLKGELDALEDRYATQQAETVKELVDKIATRQGADSDAAASITMELEDMKNELKVLGQQSGTVQRETVETLLERLSHQNQVGGNEVIERLTAELSGVKESMAQAQAQTFSALDERLAALERRDESSSSSIAEELASVKSELHELADLATSSQEATVYQLSERLEKLEAGDADVVAELRQIAEQSTATQQAAVSELAQQLRAIEAGETKSEENVREEMRELKLQLAQLHIGLQTIEERTSKVDENTVNALVEKLAARETDGAAAMEERFKTSMNEAIDQVTKALYRATAKPIDTSFEATDVLVDSIFDNEHEMTSNLGKLDVDESTSKVGISKTLGKLRKLRAGGGNDKKKKDK